MNAKIPDKITPSDGICDYCGGPVDRSVKYWRRFCSPKCKGAWHVKAARIGAQVLRKQSGVVKETENE